MAEEHYSVYDAKTRFSEILRKVRRNRAVVITNHGKAIARIVPYEEAADDAETRVERLIACGLVGESEGRLEEEAPLARRKGALDRFLETRD